MNYPEHEKLSSRQQQHETVQSFIEWLRDWDGYCGDTFVGKDLKDMTEHHVGLVIAAYFGVDPDKLEAEKRAMLEGLQDSP